MEYTTQEMDELLIQRASNPFKNQGYLWRLADMSRPQRRRRQKNQRGGALNAYLAMKSGRNVGRKLSGWLKRFKKKATWRRYGEIFSGQGSVSGYSWYRITPWEIPGQESLKTPGRTAEEKV